MGKNPVRAVNRSNTEHLLPRNRSDHVRAADTPLVSSEVAEFIPACCPVGFKMSCCKNGPKESEKAMFSQLALRLTLLTAFVIPILTAQQTGSGTVQGVVRDVSSAVVAGARVTIINTDTMVKLSTTANDAGFFGFPPVQPGSYTITVEASGMQTWEGKFLLPVGQPAEISPVLTVGAVSTQITVAGEVAPLVTTSDATISTNLEHARIEQLPENGRNIANLVLLASPGLAGGQH